MHVGAFSCLDLKPRCFTAFRLRVGQLWVLSHMSSTQCIAPCVFQKERVKVTGGQCSLKHAVSSACVARSKRLLQLNVFPTAQHPTVCKIAHVSANPTNQILKPRFLLFDGDILPTL